MLSAASTREQRNSAGLEQDKAAGEKTSILLHLTFDHGMRRKTGALADY